MMLAGAKFNKVIFSHSSEAHDHKSSWLPYVCVVHGKFMERKPIRSC